MRRESSMRRLMVRVLRNVGSSIANSVRTGQILLAGLSLFPVFLYAAIVVGAPAVEDWSLDVARNQEDGLSGLVGERVRQEIRDSSEALRRVVAEQPTRRQWDEFLNSVEADVEQLYGDRVVALERQEELIGRLKHATARMRKTLQLPGAGILANELSELTSRMERLVHVHAAAFPLISRRNIPDDLRSDVRDLLRALADYEELRDQNSAYAAAR